MHNKNNADIFKKKREKIFSPLEWTFKYLKIVSRVDLICSPRSSSLPQWRTERYRHKKSEAEWKSYLNTLEGRRGHSQGGQRPPSASLEACALHSGRQAPPWPQGGLFDWQAPMQPPSQRACPLPAEVWSRPFVVLCDVPALGSGWEGSHLPAKPSLSPRGTPTWAGFGWLFLWTSSSPFLPAPVCLST